jgi:hypothetical protein
MITAITAILGFAAFEVLAVRYGAESRPGFDEHEVRNRGPLV